MLPFLMINLGLVVVMLVVMLVRRSNLLRVSMVVSTLGYDVLFIGTGHGEVLLVCLLIIVMVSVVLVSMNVLRGHVVMAGVLVVV